MVKNIGEFSKGICQGGATFYAGQNFFNHALEGLVFGLISHGAQ